MELSLLILVCIHKSYIIYLEIYVVLIGHGFSFISHGKSMLKKRGHPVIRKVVDLVMYISPGNSTVSTSLMKKALRRDANTARWL